MTNPIATSVPVHAQESLAPDTKIESHGPLVSYLVPSYNHEKYVATCIRSIIDQDYPNIELIMIDDGSNDDSVSVIEQLTKACQDRFVRFEFRTRPNRGLSATINEAIEWSSGKYFSAIASDDVLLFNKTSQLIGCIEPEECVAAVFSGGELIDEAGSIVGLVSSPLQYYSFDEIIAQNYTIVSASQLIRLQSMKEVGCYPVGLYIEDWYMWLALTSTGKTLKVVPDLLVQYRQHDLNMSKNALKMFEGGVSVLSHFKEHALYGLAMSKLCVSAAINISWSSKRQSCGYLAKARRHHPQALFTRRFSYGLARLFVPSFFGRWLA